MSKMIPLHIADAAVAACEKEIQELREENARLKDKIDHLTPPLWLRVVAWLVSFVGAFWLAHLVLNWMHR